MAAVTHSLHALGMTRAVFKMSASLGESWLLQRTTSIFSGAISRDIHPKMSRRSYVTCETLTSGKIRSILATVRSSVAPLSSIGRRHRWTFSVGAEPGIEPFTPDQKPPEAGDEHTIQSEIRVIDFSDQRVQQHHVPSASLRSFLEGNDKPEWASCRWIYVNGLDHSIVKTIGQLEKLHRLAIEDVLDTATPAKVDWYEDHCFMEMPLQKLVRRHVDEHSTEDAQDAQVVLRDAPQKRILSKNLAIAVEQASIFLTADNTVITFFENSGGDILKPILTRIEAPQTIVRSSNDPWMLVQAVIDAIVDLSLPIGKAVDEVFGELESAVLTSPHIAQSRAVYVLRSGLTFLFSREYYAEK